MSSKIKFTERVNISKPFTHSWHNRTKSNTYAIVVNEMLDGNTKNFDVIFSDTDINDYDPPLIKYALILGRDDLSAELLR